MAFSKPIKSEVEDNVERLATSPFRSFEHEICVRESHGSGLFFLNFGARSLKDYVKEDFSQINAPCMVIRGMKCKYRGVSRATARYIFITVFPQFRAQGLFDDYARLKDASTTISNWLAWMQEIAGKLVDNKERLVLDFSNLFLSALSVGKYRDAFSITQFVLNLYNMFSTFRTIFFKAQSFEALTLLGLASALPKEAFEVLRRMQDLGGKKLMDDTDWFHRFLVMIADLIAKLFDSFQVILPDSVKPIFSVLGNWTSRHLLIDGAQKICSQFARNPHIVMDPTFCDKAERLYKQWMECPDVMEWSRRSSYVNNLEVSLVSVHKTILAHQNINRVEPTMFVFEGAPGKLKSVFMNLLLDALGKPAYPHTIKAEGDGKDFWDHYNNEDNVYMDDVGQMGVSQWRYVMNLVSSVKYVLDCADSKKKDTKFFTSKNIFVTTNQFMKINGLCRSDCIADVEALWRRGVVFDFSQTTRVGNLLEGHIKFFYYDLKEKKFVNDFPGYIKGVAENMGIPLLPTSGPISIDTPRVEYIAWMVQIVQLFEMFKENFHQAGKLSMRERENIRQLLAMRSDFVAQCEECEEDETHFDPYFYAASEPMNVVVDNMPCTSFEKDYGRLALLEWIRGVIPTLNVKLVTIGLLSVGLLITAFLGCKKFMARESTFKCQMKEMLENQPPKKHHNLVDLVQRQVLFASVRAKHRNRVDVCAIVSGHNIILPAHAVPDETVVVTLTKDYDDLHQTLVDNMIVERIYYNPFDDIAIVRLPKTYPTPFKNISHVFTESSVRNDMLMITPLGIIDVNKYITQFRGTQVYTGPNSFVGNFDGKKDIFYKIQFDGLCGCPIVSTQGSLLGFHVAGEASLDVGVTIVWSKDTQSSVRGILESDNAFYMPFDDKKPREPSSCVVFDVEMDVNVNVNNTIVESPLYGVLPVTREPANLKLFGRHTVKDVAKKSFTPTMSIPMEELEFMEEVLLDLIPEYGEISEEEVVKGNSYLAPLNKDSSNGYKNEKEKSYFVDFESGKLTQEAKKDLEQFEARILRGEYVFEDWVWTECLKVELRNVEKKRVPRSFRISRIQLQLLCKFLTGDLVGKIMSRRHDNDIMIGVNPYVEWDKIYKKLNVCPNIFDGDIGSFDGKMICSVQQVISKVVLKRFTGSTERKEVLEALLTNMFSTLVAILNRLVMTTHSMPSGSFWTALFNSFANRCYTAGWYFREMKKSGRVPTVTGFKLSISDYVYGDDKLVGVWKFPENLNAISMREYFESLGMEFTDSKKNAVVEPFNSIEDVTFLKRFFRFHPKIGRVMCPLNLRTLYSGLSWYDKKKDMITVMRDKLHCFQREMFLHNDMLTVERVLDEADKANIPYVRLYEEDLLRFYLDPQELLSANWYGWGAEKYA
jgi:hypothetical protein